MTTSTKVNNSAITLAINSLTASPAWQDLKLAATSSLRLSGAVISSSATTAAILVVGTSVAVETADIAAKAALRALPDTREGTAEMLNNVSTRISNSVAERKAARNA